MKIRNITQTTLSFAAVTFLAATNAAFAVNLAFSENFESGSAPDFTLIDAGEWSISGGELIHSASVAGNLSSAAVEVTSDLTTTGIRMSSAFSASAFGGNTDVGFGAFGTTGTFDLFAAGDDNHYLADFKPNGEMRILQINTPCCGGGSIESIAAGGAGSFTFSTLETYEMIFEATPDGVGGLNLSLTIDDPSSGVVTISGNDPTPLTGDFFGYRTRVDVVPTLNATFDDFSLTASVPEPSALALFGLGFLGLFLRRRR